ncbi:hypothetical protein KFL_011410020 [Klebsormidium nitens]|uniref:Uncharacterized protein n=1 Tax=Klebsormidium nitens TaxID=105231 RepID=A0A1Y1IQ19_KLENI|nr:hypothetical protein KFL_011410020 [Klebsormidium nitens]|eukprot:GAQ92794.1 hypothetical protein KFL_011410020 [Klebsormidium nitens]
MTPYLKDGVVPLTGWCSGHFHDLGALVHSLLTKDYSWIYCRILGLQLMRRLLLGGRALNNIELAYLRNDAPMIAAVLEFHSPQLPIVHVAGQGGNMRQYAFPPALLPLMRDIYCTNLLAFEPFANLRRATTPSPLQCLVEATDFMWGLTGEGVDTDGDAGEECTAKEARLCERAKLLLEELEVRDPSYYRDGTLRPASSEYRDQVERPSAYGFHPLLFERPHFIDWENAEGRSSKEKLERHCALPQKPHTKGQVGLFILACPHRAPLGYHYMKGAESVSDFGTVLATRNSLEALKGLTVVEDCACQLQEWFLNRLPGLAKHMLFLVDRFHSGPVSVAVGNAARRYSVHTCPPTLFIDSFPVHKDTAMTACEGLNAGLKDCKRSLQQITRLDDFKSRVTTILDINFERSKLARFVENIDAANGWLRRRIRERQAS